MPLLFAASSAQSIVPGALRVTMLDVGQGLAVVLRTAEKTLVYDTGPRMGFNLDAARASLLPLLHKDRVTQIDTLVVSHADARHSGGARTLRQALPVRRELSGDPVTVPMVAAEPCQGGEYWQWDGVEFAMLHPVGNRWVDDNGSCVLRVATPSGQRVLLTGDIDVGAEAALLRRYDASELRADVLIAPQQGARAPGAKFLAAVAPRYVLLASGYRNRYGHPRPAVVDAYRATGATILDTASSGAISFTFDNSDVSPVRHREQARRYWHTP